MADFWIFGYGSLMWNPGFETVERRKAVMHGVHRALCVYSWVHRGTEENPGLVLGLDQGGSCRGVALKVAASKRAAVINYLRERELVTHVYAERWRQVSLDGGEKVAALVYLVDRQHRQYAGRIADEKIAQIVRHGFGKSGTNIDYLINTVAHLRQSGVHDPHLEAVMPHLATKVSS